MTDKNPERKRQRIETLRKTKAQLNAILESSLDPFYALDSKWRFTVLNGAAERFLQRKREDLLGNVIWDAFPGVLQNKFASDFRRIMKGGPAETYYVPSASQPGRVVEMRVAPVKGGGLAVTFRDVTEQRRMEEQLRQQAEEFHALADNIPTLCWMSHPDGQIYWYNKKFYEYTGETPESLSGSGWESLHHPDHLPQVLARWRHSLDTGAPLEMVFPIRRRDGTYRSFLTRVAPIVDDDGAVRRWFGVNTDITDQEEQREHLRLLLNELNHRVKNTLSTIQSIAVQSLKSARSTAEGLAAFEGRLMALSTAHNVLTERNWEGADLSGLALQGVAPFAGRDPKRARITGPPVLLDPRTALALAMVLHELATNALKYGALAADEGIVTLNWHVSTEAPEPVLNLTWRESGGPPVRPPLRTGFGSRLIDRVVLGELRGSAALVYLESGVTCEISIPLPFGARACRAQTESSEPNPQAL